MMYNCNNTLQTEYSQENILRYDTSNPTCGSKPVSRTHSLTPMDVSLTLTNLRRLSQGYETSNHCTKNIEEITTVMDKSRSGDKVESSQEILAMLDVR